MKDESRITGKKACIMRIVRITLTIGMMSLFAIIIGSILPNKLIIMVPIEKQLYMKIIFAILVSSVISFSIVDKNPNNFFQKNESNIVILIILVITIISCSIAA